MLDVAVAVPVPDKVAVMEVDPVCVTETDAVYVAVRLGTNEDVAEPVPVWVPVTVIVAVLELVLEPVGVTVSVCEAEGTKVAVLVPSGEALADRLDDIVVDPVTVGEAVFVRVVVMLPVAVLLVVRVPAADCDAVAVIVPEAEAVFVSLFVGICDPVLVPDLVIESFAV